MEALTPEQAAQLAEVWRLRMEGVKAAKARRAGDAEASYRQALRLHEGALGEDDPSVLESLSALLYELCRQSRYADIEPLLDRSAILLRRRPRPEHRSILRTLDAVAEMCRKRGDHVEAERYCRVVLAAREELLGPGHPRVVSTRRAHAALLQEAECVGALHDK